VGRLSVI